MVNQAFLTLSIGPVQGFISQARRAGDLFAGSQLLSRLISAALETLASTAGCRVLYPHHQEVKAESLPNKLLARLPADQAEAVAREIENRIKTTWQDIACKARNNLAHYFPVDDHWGQMWTDQIAQLLEIYWTVTPWTEERQYPDAYDQAGRDFNARKRLRDFRLITEEGWKCTVCGERAASHRYGERARTYWREVAQHRDVTASRLRPDGRERLCAVCAVKRFGPLGWEKFPSVSYIAATPFKLALLQQMRDAPLDIGLFQALVDHNRALEALRARVSPVSPDVIPALNKVQVGAGWQAEADTFRRYDGEWLFPETYNRLADEESGLALDVIQAAREATLALGKAAKGHPTPYYAILYADGDQMGKQLSAAAQKGEEHHIQISKALALFATGEVRRIVEQERAGRVIYAGGDDVLALLPAAEVLPAANALRKAYQGAMSGLLEEPHLSAGIAIVHHLAPLEAALATAREAEKAAKERFDRNAVAVTFRKRSGEETLVGAGWTFGQSGEICETVELLDDIRRRFAEKDSHEQGFSMGLAHALLAEAPFLGGRNVPVEAQRAEIERLLIRNAAERLLKKARQAQAEKFAPALVALAQDINEREEKARKGHPGLPYDDDNGPTLVLVSRWLLLMRFLAQEGEEG